MNDENDEILQARMKEHLEAAATQNQQVYDASRYIMDNIMDIEPIDKKRTRKEILGGYLLEEWTWLNDIATSVEAGEDGVVPAPEHCEHVDPLNPTIWVALISTPNKLFCMECAGVAVEEDVQSGRELCDRCHETNWSGEFFEFAMPIVNIQVMGSICKGCLDKV